MGTGAFLWIWPSNSARRHGGEAGLGLPDLREDWALFLHLGTVGGGVQQRLLLAIAWI